MDVSRFNASGNIVIAAPAEALYDFIANMPAMGEVSPQCTGGEWVSDDRGVGARFAGSNAIGDRTWQALQQVAVADRPREFAWENIGAINSPVEPLVRWGYTFEPVEGGTRVEERWRIIKSYSLLEAFDEPSQAGLVVHMKNNIDQTLANLKARFEQ